jgi:GNAT superfamily N-acetyltransferase
MPMNVSILIAGRGDVLSIAALHAESWQSAYRGLLPDDFLAGPVKDDRLTLWTHRMDRFVPDRQHVVKAVADSEIVGFACVLLDAEPGWGALLDNLHVKPELKGLGIGWQLFRACRDWASDARPGEPMHLWVIENNLPARQFYERQGGVKTERRIIEVVPGIHVPELRYVWC